MWDKRLFVVLGCAVVFGLVAAALVSRYLSNVKAQNKNIVAAKVNILSGSQITAEQLTVIQLPPDATPAGTFDSPEKLVGRVAITAISVKEPVTQIKLAPQGSEAGLAAMIAEGARAMTVKVDDVVGVAGFVTPGAFVDIVAVVNPSDNGSTEGPTSKIVLQYIKVLASDRNIEKRESGEAVVTVKAVTLQVTPEQAEKLALAATEGKLQLVMRNSVDKDDVHTLGINKRGLMTGEAAVIAAEPGLPMTKVADASPAPRRRTHSPSPPRVAEIKPYGYGSGSEKPKPASSRNSIEIIEGSKRRTVEFP